MSPNDERILGVILAGIIVRWMWARDRRIRAERAARGPVVPEAPTGAAWQPAAWWSVPSLFGSLVRGAGRAWGRLRAKRP